MKQKDVIAQRILSTGIAIAAVLLSAGFFMNSIGTSYAANNTPNATFDFPESIETSELPAILAENGRYMAQYEAFYDPSIEKQQAYVFVWDTQTGASKIYMWRTGDTSFKAVTSSGFQPSVTP